MRHEHWQVPTVRCHVTVTVYRDATRSRALQAPAVAAVNVHPELVRRSGRTNIGVWMIEECIAHKLDIGGGRSGSVAEGREFERPFASPD
jgi:glutamate dehydrogenase/leucine dehydrogenase